ncbi:FadR/GntR family transcriptional regulator [Orrella sp. JC864]|uniref:FadR/GntR family transcriptional regulator n=1 Tax=Orrella sp. JC864 TaxID=3120298 RepID=UPI003009E33C
MSRVQSNARARGALREPAAEDLRAQRPPRLADQLYDRLLQQITYGKYPEESRLPSEFELCAAFGVSRPVVREALFRLQADGVIVSQRGAGSYVRRRPSPELIRLAPIGGLAELVRCMELRGALEGEAAYMAAMRRGDEDIQAIAAALQDMRLAFEARQVGNEADYRFHQAIAAACGNDLFVTMLQSLSQQIFDYMRVMRSLALASAASRGQQVQREHERIFQAIRDQRPEQAREAMREHIYNSRMRTLDASFSPGANRGPGGTAAA